MTKIKDLGSLSLDIILLIRATTSVGFTSRLGEWNIRVTNRTMNSYVTRSTKPSQGSRVIKQQHQFSIQKMFAFTTVVAILLGIAIRLKFVELRWLFAIIAAYVLMVAFVLVPWWMREWLEYRKRCHRLNQRRKIMEREAETRLNEHREQEPLTEADKPLAHSLMPDSNPH